MSDDWSGEVIDASNSVTDKPTDAVAQARAELEAAMSWLTTDESHRIDALIAAVRAECAADTKRVNWLEKVSRKDGVCEVGWSPAGFESDEYGGNRSEWMGGYYAYSSDRDGYYDHPTLRIAIDSAMEAQP